jgi:hypothetical protein
MPKNIELMPQHQDLGLQLLSRLEAVARLNWGFSEATGIAGA